MPRPICDKNDCFTRRSRDLLDTDKKVQFNPPPTGLLVSSTPGLRFAMPTQHTCSVGCYSLVSWVSCQLSALCSFYVRLQKQLRVVARFGSKGVAPDVPAMFAVPFRFRFLP